MDEEDDGGGQICVLVDAVEMSEKKVYLTPCQGKAKRLY